MLFRSTTKGSPVEIPPEAGLILQLLGFEICAPTTTLPLLEELRNEFGDVIKANKKSVIQPPRNNSINPNNLPYTQVQPGEVKPKFVEGTQYVTDSGVVDTSYLSGARQVKYKNTDKKTKDKKKLEHNGTTTTSTTHYAFLNALPPRQ